jgi:hypothetical protein
MCCPYAPILGIGAAASSSDTFQLTSLVVQWWWCVWGRLQGEKIKRVASVRHAPLGQQILEGDAPKQRSRVMKVKKTSGEGDEVSVHVWWVGGGGWSG